MLINDALDAREQTSYTRISSAVVVVIVVVVVAVVERKTYKQINCVRAHGFRAETLIAYYTFPASLVLASSLALIGCASNNIINYSDKRDRVRRRMYRGKGARESRHDDLFNRTTARKHDKNLMENDNSRRIRATNGAWVRTRESGLISPPENNRGSVIVRRLNAFQSAQSRGCRRRHVFSLADYSNLAACETPDRNGLPTCLPACLACCSNTSWFIKGGWPHDNRKNSPLRAS